MLVKSFEYVRWLCVALGFYLAYQHLSVHSLYWLCLLVVLPLTGFTALESLFFAKAAALSKQREVGSAYQIQSALNNLATASVTVVVLVFSLGTGAQLAVSLVGIVFFFFSSIKHALEYFLEGKGKIHLLRFLCSLALVGFTVPIWMRSWPH
jgi:hypothetical protein